MEGHGLPMDTVIPPHARLRFAHPSDDIKSLWRLCFPGTDDRIYFEREYKPENVLVFADTQKVYSMAHLLYTSIWMDNRSVPAGYLFGVATHPEFRGFGFAGGLIEQALFEFYLRGIPLAALIAGNASMVHYYERFGFAALEMPAVLSAQEVRAARISDIPMLSKLYDSAFSCRIERSESDWRSLLEEYEIAITQTGYTVCSEGKLLETLPIGVKEIPSDNLPAMLRIVRADWLHTLYPDLPPHGIDRLTPWNNPSAVPGGLSAEALFLQKHQPYINLLHN